MVERGGGRELEVMGRGLGSWGQIWKETCYASRKKCHDDMVREDARYIPYD